MNLNRNEIRLLESARNRRMTPWFGGSLIALVLGLGIVEAFLIRTTYPLFVEGQITAAMVPGLLCMVLLIFLCLQTVMMTLRMNQVAKLLLKLDPGPGANDPAA